MKSNNPTLKGGELNVFDTNGVAVRAPDVPIPRFCMEFRPGSNGQGPGPQKPEEVFLLLCLSDLNYELLI